MERFIAVIVMFILIFLAAILHNASKKDTKNTVSWLFLIVGIILSLVLLGYIIYGIIVRVSDSSSTADGFTIKKYQVYLDVNESGSINVQETIDINFYENFHHGIIRFIPYWLEYTTQDGKTMSRKATISNVSVLDDVYIVNEVKKKLRIRIGNADITLKPGVYTYVINYTYDMGGDPYKGFDEFIFHAFGDYWGTPIENAEVIINMPDNFDTQDIKFFADKKRKKDITEYIDYSINGNVIDIKVKDDYSLNSALTIDIPLPEGYFTSGSNNYGYISMLLCLISISIGCLSFLIWRKNGKDFRKGVPTVEFYPPEGLDPAEVGMIYKKTYGSRLEISLLISLANKKYIKIEENEKDLNKGVNKIIITNNLKGDINKALNRVITATVVKKFPKIMIFPGPEKERAKLYYEKYFGKETEITIDSKYDQFISDTKYLVDNGYITIKDSLDDYSKEEIVAKEKEIEVNNAKLKYTLPKLSTNEQSVYNALFTEKDVLDLSEDRLPVLASSIYENVSKTYDNNIHDLTSYNYKIFASLLFIINIICFGVSYCFVEDLNPLFNILYYLSFISMIVTFILALFMGRKTPYGEEMEAKIEGFKHYLEVAEKEQLDRITADNKHYFYDILPYAYVLGVSKAWIDKFKDYIYVDEDLSVFSNYDTFSDFESSCETTMIPISSSGGGSSSGCSSCGGGCSSCGGGCSSCGGGGSW